MATPPPLPIQPTVAPNLPETTVAVELAAEKALVPQPIEGEEEQVIPLTVAQARLPVELDVAVPIRDFRVRTLLALEPGQVIETQWSHGEDLPLAAGEVQLAWSEFEVVDAQLAVRVTRLA